MHGRTHRSVYVSLKMCRMLGSGGIMSVGTMVGVYRDVGAGIVGSCGIGSVHSVGCTNFMSTVFSGVSTT